MASQNVIQLKTTKNTPATRRTRKTRAAVIRKYAPAAGLGTVILVLLYLSLNHLAHGIQVVTLCQDWEGLAMAIGLDLLIVGLEVAMVATAGTKSYKPVARFANPALITAFAWSSGLNGFAFSANQTELMWKVVAAALGLSIPVLICLGTRAWAALAINSRQA
jgi:hypothetical protein